MLSVGRKEEDNSAVSGKAGGELCYHCESSRKNILSVGRLEEDTRIAVERQTEEGKEVSLLRLGNQKWQRKEKDDSELVYRYLEDGNGKYLMVP